MIKRDNRLESLGRQEFEVMRKIIDDDDIVRALLYPDVEFLDKDVPPLDEREYIAFKFVYPFDFIPYNNNEEVETKGTYITISFTDYRPNSNTRFKANVIQINIFTHQDIERVEALTMTRSKFIATRIDELFNDTRGFGLGKLNFYGMNAVRISNNFQGYSMRYQMTDFN